MSEFLVTIFLRGGADGLALVPPVGDDDYHRLRPTLARRAGIALDHRFHLAPELAALEPWYREGRLSVLPAVATSDASRSHFVAQPLAERGGAEAVGGWVSRWLLASGAGPLGGVAFGDRLPESLRGGAGVVAIKDLAELDPGPVLRRHRATLARLYADDPLLAGPAHTTLDAADRLSALVSSGPHSAAAYPTGTFGRSLAQAAALLRAGVGVRACCVDLDGWDSHVGQGTLLGSLLHDLGAGLAAFATDLGPLLERTSIVVLTEFGRRAAENSGLGTDHGHGFAMLVLGGGTPGGIVGEWPGLGRDDLVGPGDLAGSSDWRSVLAGVLGRHDPAAASQVFGPDVPALVGV